MKNASSILIVLLVMFCSCSLVWADALSKIAGRAAMNPVSVTKNVTTGSFKTINRVNTVSLNSIKQINTATLDMTKHINTATLNMTKQVNMGSLTLTKQLFKNPSTAVDNLKDYGVDCKNQMIQEKDAFKETSAKYIDQHKGNNMEGVGYVKDDKADLTKIMKEE